MSSEEHSSDSSSESLSDSDAELSGSIIGQSIKLKIFREIKNMRENDPVLDAKIETEGISCLRIQITKWVAEAWEEICQGDSIPLAFKKCGLCNDIHERENHLVTVAGLKTYKVPSKEFVLKKQAYPQEEIVEMIQDEITQHTSTRKKRKLEKTAQRILKRAKKNDS